MPGRSERTENAVNAGVCTLTGTTAARHFGATSEMPCLPAPGTLAIIALYDGEFNCQSYWLLRFIEDNVINRDRSNRDKCRQQQISYLSNQTQLLIKGLYRNVEIRPRTPKATF